MSQDPKNHFAYLAQRALDGELAPEEARDFNALLQGDATLREEYRRHCELHGVLSSGKSTDSTGAPDVFLLATATGSPPRSLSPALGIGIGIAAAALGITVSALFFLRSTPSAAPIAPVVAIAAATTTETRTTEASAEKSGNLPDVASLPVAPGAGAESSKNQTPEDNYRNMLAVVLEPGSQNRPPQKSVPVVAAAPAHEGVSFNRDIRPILSEHCFHCHGPDAESRKADLRLDTEEGAFTDLGGYLAFDPEDPDASEALARMITEDADELMPPPETHKPLSQAQIALIRRWVEEGAEWEAHWAFTPVSAPNPPEPAAHPQAPVRNPVDAFIQAALASAGIEPSPEADPATLIRRLSFDLTGLPPGREEAAAFLATWEKDPAAAYDAAVDRLLASPRYGEHRGRYWLDVARYADTHGFHLDNYRSIWPYRDWVIDAFNANMPFNQFTIEQLAGDLLPDPTLEQVIATGFNRCNPTTAEGGFIPAEYEVIYATDRVETTMAVWNGLTAGCAACHDHKFDPITQRDFYELSAFFRNTTMPASDGNRKDHAPVAVIPLDEDKARWDGIPAEIGAERKRLGDFRQNGKADLEQWLASTSPRNLGKIDPRDRVVHLLLDEGAGDQFPPLAGAGTPTGAHPVTINGTWHPESRGKLPAKHVSASPFDGPHAQLGDFEHDQPFSYGAWVKVPQDAKNGPIFARMRPADEHRGWDLYRFPNGSFGAHIIHRWPGNAIRLNGPPKSVKPDQWHHVFVTYDGSGKAAGIKLYLDGSPQQTTVTNDNLNGSIRTEAPFALAARDNQEIQGGVFLQDVQVFGRELDPLEISTLFAGGSLGPLLAVPAQQRTPEDLRRLKEHYFTNVHPGAITSRKRITRLERARAAIRKRAHITLVMGEKPNSKPMAHILERGAYDQEREQVGANTPGFLPPIPDGVEPDRLALAQWLVSPENPLTARVTVNRIWQELFGTGLVKTSEDFGIMGETPSHPELLDWLATRFVESGWDVKAFYRHLVSSHTYRQSARVRPGDLETDPQNRLLARAPRFRLDAEIIRDQALFLSGLLNPEVGGPSVKPPQPAGLWKTVGYVGSNTAIFKQDTGPAIYRRSLYTFWKRTSPPPTMSIFDAPDRESCTVRRERTNTPLQALVLMNEPQFVEAARGIATRLLNTTDIAKQDDSRLARLYQVVTSHQADEATLGILRTSLEDFTGYFRDDPEGAAALIQTGDSPPDPNLAPELLAPWTFLASQLLNLDEVINKN